MLQVSTHAVGPREKIAFWRDLVCRHLVSVQCQSIADPAQFSGEIVMRTVAEVALAQITSTAQTVTRTPRLIAEATCEQVLVNIQREGSGGVEQDGRLAVLRPGDITLYTSGRRYDLFFDAPFQQTAVILPADQLRAKIPGLDALTAIPLDGQHPATRLFVEMATQYAQADVTRFSQAARVRAANALTELLAATVAAFVPSATTAVSNLSLYHLTRIKQYVMEHVHEPQLSVATVSQALHISPAHIHRLFEGEPQTFTAWLWSWRLLNCKRALENEAETHRSMTEIAFGNGFSSSSHFSRVFRQQFGMSPSEYRDRHRSSRRQRS